MTQTVALPELDFKLPLGFRWGFAEAGIKYANRRDVALVASDSPASAGAVFTQNLFQAAPVLVSRETMRTSAGIVGGVITNAGCANAATGEVGKLNAVEMVDYARSATQSDSPYLVCSTGTIGVQLPMEKIKKGIDLTTAALASSEEAFIGFANAILTTDTHLKVAHGNYHLNGKEVRILGCAKGSGMMQPNMATMLAYVFTDAEIDHALLQEVFTKGIKKSINCVTVDGDTSTNDTAIILASGKSGAKVSRGSSEEAEFELELTKVLQSLAKQLARDGEGATKLIEVEVAGCRNYEEGRKAALAVANSPLVKTAIHGRDANWGRIACALGYSGVPFDSSLTDISISSPTVGNIELMKKGTPIIFDEEFALKILTEEVIRIDANIHTGDDSVTVWTCDLTDKYIEINGSYRT